MPHKNSVSGIKSGLVNIGLTPRKFTARSPRNPRNFSIRKLEPRKLRNIRPRRESVDGFFGKANSKIK